MVFVGAGGADGRESRRLGNARLRRELGVKLRWGTVGAFLGAVAEKQCASAGEETL